MAIKISVNPRRLAVFHQAERDEAFKDDVIPERIRINNERKQNDLSQKAKKRLRDTLSWLVTCSSKRDVMIDKKRKVKNFQISFVTLTLPTKQMHTHKEIKSKCLNLFLQNLRNKFGVKNYVWKAELQKNGNIHFHLSFDKPIHFMTIRRYWNMAIEKLGYVSTYAKTMNSLTFEEYAYYQKQNGHNNKQKLKRSFEFGQATQWTSPNTTDVKSVKKIQNWASYMSKYMTKDPADKSKTGMVSDSLTELTGRLWFCSTSLSKLKASIIDYSFDVRRLVSELAKVKSTFEVVADWCRLLFFDARKLPFKVQEMIRFWLFDYVMNTGYEFPAGFPKF